MMNQTPFDQAYTHEENIVILLYLLMEELFIYFGQQTISARDKNFP